jgi:WhiB family redox-sensing transcriptional regulator
VTVIDLPLAVVDRGETMIVKTPSAPCAQSDPDAWFPEKGETPTWAKRICARCDVRALCLANALWMEDAGVEVYGVWGGLSIAERRRLTLEERQAVFEHARELRRVAA